jgi:hypothetical protein
LDKEQVNWLLQLKEIDGLWEMDYIPYGNGLIFIGYKIQTELAIGLRKAWMRKHPPKVYFRHGMSYGNWRGIIGSDDSEG